MELAPLHDEEEQAPDEIALSLPELMAPSPVLASWLQDGGGPVW